MGRTYDIVPARLVVKALQDSGYKNAAYAVAELIDNSAQAGADLVQLMCHERTRKISQRQRARLDEVAVLDNGSGMNPETLRAALQFGNGSHLGDRDGIGRFGMGLPNSSMSQGSRVEVWSWHEGVDSAIFSYLDLDEISSGDLAEVPEPVSRALPKKWVERADGLGTSGTLVVWTRPDRCTWKTARALVKNSELLIGRIYRRFLNDGRLRIRMATFRDAEAAATSEHFAVPNAPLYLMEHTSCPEPFSEEAMFEPWGEDNTQTLKVSMNGDVYPVTLRYSVARKEARSGHNPGSNPHGKHAAANIGLSVMRADRELELDPKWFPGYDPTTRWMGIELDFPPALDEIFGVTNNKQAATHLADLAGMDKEELAARHGFGSYAELQEVWHEDSDPREPLLKLKDAIDSAIRHMLSLLKVQTKNKRKRRRKDDPNEPEAVATAATKKRQNEGHQGASDAHESDDPKERIAAVTKGLEDNGVPHEAAAELAARTIELGRKYVFSEADSHGGSFFSVKPKGGSVIITLNTSHPAYENLIEVLESDEETEGVEELNERLGRARDGLKLLLAAWARHEDEVPDGRRHAVQDMREDWGRMARAFMMTS